MGTKKIYNILVVGSGLSSLSFIDTYLKRKKKIDIISYENKKIDTSGSKNSHIFKILPPQMLGKKKKVKTKKKRKTKRKKSKRRKKSRKKRTLKKGKK